jgi:hypothetical protein
MSTQGLFDGDDTSVIDPIWPHDLLAMWNAAAKTNNMRGARNLGDAGSARIRRTMRLVRLHPARSFWQSVIDRIVASGFCTGRLPGRDGRLWRADFDFLTRYETHTKVLEGKYDDDNFQKSHRSASRGRAVVYDDTIGTMPMRRITGGH